MLTLLVGILMVTVSAIGFGLALFGRRPVPQPATVTATEHPVVPGPEQRPSSPVAASTIAPPREDLEVTGPWWRRLLAREATAERQPTSDVTLSPWVRVRSAFLLGLTVVGLAALIGGVLSVLVVGAVLLLT
jgi:hypothetical protein